MFVSSRHFHSWFLAPVLISWLIVGSNILENKSSHLTAQNSPPVAVDDSFTVHGQRQLTPLTNDYDPDNDSFSLYSYTQPQHGGILTGTSTTYTYLANSGYVGADSITYTIRDSFGNNATGTINITVVNQAPIAEEDSYTVHGQLLIAPIANDHDPESDGVTFQAIVTPPQHGDLFPYNSTMFTYRPTYGYVGEDSFTYRIQDGYGALAIGTVHITVVNQNPIAEDDFYTVHGQLLIAPIANDHDPESDGVTFVAIVTPPQHGDLNQYNSTMFTYRPATGYNGADSFTYRIQDGYGAVATGTVHFTDVNESPIAEEDFFTIHGQGVVRPLANDHDPESDGVSFVAIVAQPQHGTLMPYNGYGGEFTYLATYGYVGADSFTYRVQDGWGATSVGTAHIDVVNIPPLAFPDLYFWKSGLWMRPAENDIDLDGDAISFGAVTTWPQYGGLNGVATGAFTYGPNQGTLVDHFLYSITDGYGGTGIGVSIILVPADTWNLGRPGCKGVGQPVDVTTGNMYLEQHDYQSSGLAVTRSYNSKSQATGLFGRGWSTDYDNSIVADNVYVVHLRQGDGRVIYFYRGSTSGPFAPATPDFHAQLTPTSNGYSLTFLDGSTEQFDSTGKLLSFADRNGNTTMLTYGAGNFLTSIIDPLGRQLGVATDSNGQITAIADSVGTIATYTYGSAHQLLSVTYADNSVYNFSYDGSYRLLNVTDALSNVVEAHQYDSQGRATTSEVQGAVEHYAFNYVSETETDVTDGLGHVTKYTFDKVKGRTVLTRVEGVCGCGGSGSQVQTWTYDDKLNLTSKTDALGHSRSYTYDANGNPLTETDATGTVTYTYNTRGEILTRTDQLNGVTTNTYDAQGNLLTVKDALNNTTTLTYNSRGQVLTVVDPREKTTTLVYDTNGNLSEREDANDNDTTFVYDDRDRLTQVNDALNQATLYEYDAVGRIKKITHPDLSFISFTFDLAGRRTVATDERGNSTNYGYDGANRLTSVTDAANHATTYGYNSMSRLTSVTDALSHVTNYEYDDFNRLVKTTFPAATTGATRLFETIGYDAAGKITQRTDTAGRVTSYAYDSANRLTSTTDPANKTTSFGYDALSRTTSVTDALNQQYQFGYDALGRQTQITRGGVSMSYQYDAAGNRTQRTDHNAAVTNYEYDNLNRLTTIIYPDSTTVDYGYDEISRLTAATNANGTVSLTYDNRNRAASVAGVFGQTVSYGYDVAGNRTSMGLGGSNYASYSYDGVNRLNTITDSGSLAITYGYDATNKLTSRTLPNGITTTYDYDGLNRLTRLRHTTATATFTDNQYNYDTANRISQLTDLGGVHAYSYDSVDRLASATYPGATAESYAYDGVGNRTTSHLSASYTYQPFNKVTNAGGVTYTYDNNGNLLTKVAGTATTQYAWDFENRLTQVTLPSGTVVNYKYDALGRRIQRTTSTGDDERYVYDGRNVVQDLDSSSAVVNSYLNGPGIDNHLRQTNATNGASYFLTDHLGSTVGLTDSSANLVEQISYDSFGNHAPSNRTRYTYTGRERDADTGLMYYRARFYDPQLGRFVSNDPIGLNGGINPYAYGLNNPTRFVDPSGLDIWDSVLGAVAEHYLGDERVVIAALAIPGHVAAGFGDSITGGLADMVVQRTIPGMPPPSSFGWTPTGAIRNRNPSGNHIDPCNGLYKGGQWAAVAWSVAMMVEGARVSASELPASPPRSVYMPFDAAGDPVPLPKQTVGGVDIPTPLPEAQGPHTTLGTRIGSDGIPYRQSAEFPGSSWPQANGQDVPLSRVDWTNHGRYWDHTNPHQHILSPTGPGGTWQLGPQTLFWRPWWRP